MTAPDTGAAGSTYPTREYRMSETAPAEATAEAPTTTPAPTPPAPPPAPDTDTTDWKAEVAKAKAEADKWTALARKHEERARGNAAAAKEVETLKAELDKLRTASMSDQEKALAKAVKEAEQRVRGETLSTVGQRLVRAEFRALSAGAIPDLNGVLDDLNLAKFVGADGEPDTKAIEAAVKRLTPPPPPAPEPAASSPLTPGPRPDLTQGARTSMPLNGDPILAAVKSKLNIP